MKSTALLNINPVSCHNRPAKLRGIAISEVFPKIQLRRSLVLYNYGEEKKGEWMVEGKVEKKIPNRWASL
jgi:hypothetical protein